VESLGEQSFEKVEAEEAGGRVSKKTPRLVFDRILASEYETQAVKESIKSDDPHVILVDNVSLRLAPDKKRNHLLLIQDVPNAAPPFKKFFMEHQPPTKQRGADGVLKDHTGEIATFSRETGASIDQDIKYGVMFEYVNPPEVAGVGDPLFDGLSDDARWLVAATVFRSMRVGGNDLTHGWWTFSFSVGEEGKILMRPDGMVILGGPYGNHSDSIVRALEHEAERFGRAIDEEIRNHHLFVIRDALFPALMAISFMHCKNVVRKTMEPKEHGRFKKKENRHRKPEHSYVVLEIEPLKAILESEGMAETQGLEKALHVCRGHFKTYTPDAPMFGKHVGSFFFAEHIRGSGKSGTITKDYVVNEPAVHSSDGGDANGG
jgi:hypothetical protein